MKYPNDQYNEKKQEYIGILSNLAIAADRLISYYREEDFLGASREAEVKELSHIYYDEKPEESLEDKMRKLF
jgi:hypothetical protein